MAQVGPWRLVALAATRLEVRALPGGILAHGGKEPVAVLAAGAGRILAFAPDGSPLDPAPLIAAHPGLAEALAGEGG